MLTARAETHDVVTGFDAGADDYLRKPFEIPELMSRVRVLLRRSESEAPCLAVSGFGHRDRPRISPGDGRRPRRRTHRQGVRAPRVPRHERRRVITREEILDAVWGGQHGGDSNVIEVFVHHLRNKIGDRDNKIIQTVRGVGYFFARG